MATIPHVRTRFSEPVVDSGADPYVVIHEDYFYYIHVLKDEAIYIRKAKTLDGIGQAEPVRVWPGPDDHSHDSIWAPELHFLDGKWYVYFADGIKNEFYTEQRMYVLEGEGSDPQSATYTFKGKLSDSSDEWAIDGTVLNLDNGARYFIWSGWENKTNIVQNLYIAEMANPWTLVGERVKIASPVFDWELNKIGINEGPQILPQGKRRHIIYSASHSLTDYYCLGQLTLVGDNPLDPTHWIKRDQPVYQSHKGVIAPGHASFILTPDESYGWMIFHTARHSGSAWDRQIRLAAFKLMENGSPAFLPTSGLFTPAWPAKRLKGLLEKMVRRPFDAKD